MFRKGYSNVSISFFYRQIGVLGAYAGHAGIYPQNANHYSILQTYPINLAWGFLDSKWRDVFMELNRMNW